jgi:hypothetical protein
MPTITLTGSFIPDDDAGIRLFLNNFAEVVAQNPAACGLTASDSATLTALAQAYDELYVLANNPLTRTTPVVAEKDAARNQAVETVRIYATQIKANLGVPEQLKIALGIHIDDTTRTPIPAPQTSPVLTVEATNALHEIRFSDSMTPGMRAKPPGAIQLQLFRAMGDSSIADVSEAQFIGAHSRQPILLTYDPTPANTGKTATYFARWCTAKGLVGPWGPPVAATIAFSGVVNQSQSVPSGGGGQPMTLSGGGGDEQLKIAA